MNEGFFIVYNRGSLFISVLSFLRCFNAYARYAANFRDHALSLYSKSRLRPEARRFPRISYVQRPAGVSDAHFPGLIRLSVDPREAAVAEIIDDCKTGMVSVVGGNAAPAAVPVNGLMAEQLADFFANDPNFGGRFVVTGN